ncbi:ferredoxin-type protein NapF [Thaumasiovibrio subtropicus]|uniref:ferredoxin-type protein NapF n=1 Tax=Thaumasiovibrio subtropicus TaxID=1891207 RepID=UPI000B35A321|nr:ferredoxin-type protein NapF [Thaumasiovibrio subtropicus]
MDSSKRQFWKRALGQKRSPNEVSLPWTQADFTERCTRCRACVDACETAVIKVGDGGFPVVDLSQGECTFCYACAAHCDVDGLFSSQSETPWQHKVQVLDAVCLPYQQVTCRSCSDSCETRAIRFQLQLKQEATPEIDINQCTGCGSCVSVCPTNAIEVVSA